MIAAVVIGATLAGAVVLAAGDHGSRSGGRPPATVSSKGAHILVPVVKDFPREAVAQDETSSKILLTCRAGQRFWRAAAAKVSAPIIAVGGGSVRTVAGDFRSVAAADRMYTQLGDSRQFGCYGDNIRRFIRQQAAGVQVAPSQILPGGKVDAFSDKSRVYLISTSTDDGNVRSYVELAVFQRGRRMWIVAASQLAAPPTELLETAARALERSRPRQ